MNRRPPETVENLDIEILLKPLGHGSIGEVEDITAGTVKDLVEHGSLLRRQSTRASHNLGKVGG